MSSILVVDFKSHGLHLGVIRQLLKFETTLAFQEPFEFSFGKDAGLIVFDFKTFIATPAAKVTREVNIVEPNAKAADSAIETLFDHPRAILAGAKPTVDAAVVSLEAQTQPGALAALPTRALSPLPSAPPLLDPSAAPGAVLPAGGGGAMLNETPVLAPLPASPIPVRSPANAGLAIREATPAEEMPQPALEWTALTATRSIAGLAPLEQALDEIATDLNATCVTLAGLMAQAGPWPGLLMTFAVIVAMQEIARARRKPTPLERIPLGLKL